MANVTTSGWIRGMPIGVSALVALPALAQELPPGFGRGAAASEFDGPSWLDFSFMIPQVTSFMWLAVMMIGAAGVFYGAYRTGLRSQVLQGVHPARFVNTLFLSGVILIGMFGYLFLRSIGSGYFLILAAVLFLLSLGLSVARSILFAWVVAIFALVTAAVVLRIFDFI